MGRYLARAKARKGGPNLRYRIEIAAALLAHVIEHAYDAAVVPLANFIGLVCRF